MFEAFARRGNKQKCSMRHAEPGYLKASKRASRALSLNLQKLKEVTAPIRSRLASRPDESEILRSVGKVAVSEASSSGIHQGVVSSSESREPSDYRPPSSLDLGSLDLDS